MKIGIIKETKIPVDNRVALTPAQLGQLKAQYPYHIFKVQSSEIRAYTDDEYRKHGIQVVDNVDDCDMLFGIKEADITTLQRGKHYVFFGHIAKMQPYNKPLFKTLINNRDTFSDYEYLIDSDGKRLVAFGWYAGVVGMYYTLRGWGLRGDKYQLPAPHINFSMQELISNLRSVDLGNIKIVVTGRGRVSKGAQYVLKEIGATELSITEFQNNEHPKGLVYCVANVEDLVKRRNDGGFNREEFDSYPERYESNFDRFAVSADILVSCHFWANNQPVYLAKDSFLVPDFRIRMIGDITCDIEGSIQSTVRSSTHSDPYFDYNPYTGKEEKAFSSANNITVMAVDTCPNALPRETSEYFGDQLIKYVLNDLLKGNLDTTPVLDKSTILYGGELTERFNYLKDYIKTL